MAQRYPRRSARNAKSKLFAATFILTIVFGLAFFFTARSYMRHVRREKAEEQYRKAAYLITNGSFQADKKSGGLRVTSGDYTFALTMNPKLQRIAEELFMKYEPVTGAFILMDSQTGELLTMAAYSRKRKDLPFYGTYRTCMDPVLRSGRHPMASIAKLVTSSAAIELKIAGPGDRFNCTGAYRVKGGGTVHDPRGVAHGSITMARALATSCNPSFAQIGLKVGRENLEKYYARYLFNQAIEFDLPVTESGASIGEGDYAVAMAGAGFEGTWMSPLHAVLIAGAIQNDGVMMRPFMVESFERKGKNVYRAKPEILAETVNKKTAKTIRNMMSGTVNEPGGTAHRGFFRKDREMVPGMNFDGKTGSINGEMGDDFYTWFIGHTEKGGRKLSFSTMVVNDGEWKIKAASYTGQFFVAAADKIE